MTTDGGLFMGGMRVTRTIHIGVIWCSFTNTSTATRDPAWAPATRRGGRGWFRSCCSNPESDAMQIRFDQKECADFEAASRREWLETNGLGGFASSTVIGMNTRRYHG